MYIQVLESNVEAFRDRDIILFGAGSSGVKALEEFQKRDAKVIGFCDNNRERKGELVQGYPIITPEDLYAIVHDRPDVSVMITSTYINEIKKQLAEHNVTNVYVVQMGVLYDKIPLNEFDNPVLDNTSGEDAIYNSLMGDAPAFIGRLGSTELETICNYLYFEHRKDGDGSPYSNNIKNMLSDWCGFFPKEDEAMDQFCELYLQDIQNADILWSMWNSKFENKIYREYCPTVPLVSFDDTAFPIYSEMPWTRALKGKKVLVIHPFEESIIQNYQVKDKLFSNMHFMPDYELITMKAVQTLADNKDRYTYKSWFDALASMEQQIGNIDFDIALIGAGAYGFPLGAFVKRIGKKALHLGGILQLFFGIRGKYYDQFNYHNEYWTRPLEEEKPKGFKKVEAGRYW